MNILIKRLKRKMYHFGEWIWRHIIFFIKIIIWVAIFYLLFPTLVTLFNPGFKEAPVTLSDLILIITAAFILIYTYETQQMKREISKQNEIEQAPILVLYMNEILGTDCVFRLRNIGKGPAFNVRLIANDFEVNKYGARFFAPKDEYAIIVSKKIRGKFKSLAKFKNFTELQNAIFSIYCESLSGWEYYFDYKIADIEEKRVEFLKMDRI